jgi:hypothetical protein
VSIYVNPFYARASEQHQDAHQFVSTFGAGALDMLPAAAWDRLVLLRSSPGAGKTSLMRLFTPQNLQWAIDRMRQEPVHRQLVELGAIDANRPLKLGVLIDLDRDYRSLLDLPMPTEAARRLFLRLLDVRILVGAMRSALSLAGGSFPRDIERITLASASGDARVGALVERLGGPSTAGILTYAQDTERVILRLLDALLAIDVDGIPDGHNELYALELLDSSRFEIDGDLLDVQPLVMFDDGHRLDREQRDVLLGELRRRRPTVARWYSERFEALSDQELLSDVGAEGRDVALVDLDSIARSGSADGRRFLRGRYDRVLTDIARRRAAPLLATYAQEHQGFLDLLDDDADGSLADPSTVLPALEGRTLAAAAGDDRYKSWIEDARTRVSFDAAVRWREVEVLVLRDQHRQQDLFGQELTDEDFADRSSSSLREGAALAVANEFKLPYYFGAPTVVRLGSHNAHQFLNLCGDLFAEMLVDISLGRPPRLDVSRQHRVLHRASERLWESIPRTVPNGRDVQVIVREIVTIAQEENVKPRMPYPPGITGTALLMSDRQTLLDPQYRAKHPGSDRLFAALASAVAHNILQADLDYSVKGNRYMVMYLNRLLCPRFGLPLGLGGFKERRLSEMVNWMQKLPAQGSRRRSVDAEERLAL